MQARPCSRLLCPPVTFMRIIKKAGRPVLTPSLPPLTFMRIIKKAGRPVLTPLRLDERGCESTYTRAYSAAKAV